jgi:hypothetical protein
VAGFTLGLVNLGPDHKLLFEAVRLPVDRGLFGIQICFRYNSHLDCLTVTLYISDAVNELNQCIGGSTESFARQSPLFTLGDCDAVADRSEQRIDRSIDMYRELVVVLVVIRLHGDATDRD